MYNLLKSSDVNNAIAFKVKAMLPCSTRLWMARPWSISTG